MLEPMRCPQCTTELETGDRNQCPQCGGMFVGDQELNKMLATVDAKKNPNERRTTADWPVGEDVSERKCPVCDQAMHRMTMERVIVERCTPHGVWFDKNELQRVLAPNKDEVDHDGPRSVADTFELGSLGTVVGIVYSQIRRTKPH